MTRRTPTCNFSPICAFTFVFNGKCELDLCRSAFCTVTATFDFLVVPFVTLCAGLVAQSNVLFSLQFSPVRWEQHECSLIPSRNARSNSTHPVYWILSLTLTLCFALHIHCWMLDSLLISIRKSLRITQSIGIMFILLCLPSLDTFCESLSVLSSSVIFLSVSEKATICFAW